ncbi:hypothetical protein WICMUC_002616 [Wickerhamomyces mucosus]|uniref:Uncharacterized protein n=1 Tax=Wickerhamomyces mucosus TaxID=1378264 RepID=A0A9P8PNT3_9ASCO|nr:hypothetical protein WICMUC_002616 [Wickerhamomyces mucosus]
MEQISCEQDVMVTKVVESSSTFRVEVKDELLKTSVEVRELKVDRPDEIGIEYSGAVATDSVLGVKFEDNNRFGSDDDDADDDDADDDDADDDDADGDAGDDTIDEVINEPLEETIKEPLDEGAEVLEV